MKNVALPARERAYSKISLPRGTVRTIIVWTTMVMLIATPLVWTAQRF